MTTQRKIVAGDGDPRHGTRTGYVNSGCTCEMCREAHRAYQSVLRGRLKARGLPPGDPRHGTGNGYRNWGCRCPECTQANTDYSRDRRNSRQDA